MATTEVGTSRKFGERTFEAANEFIRRVKDYLGTVGLLVSAVTTLIGLGVVLANKAGLPRSTVWFLCGGVGLPLIVALATTTIPDWLARRRRDRVVRHRPDAGSRYFQIGPREDPEDFARADNAHVEVLNWLKAAREPVLVLTGRSGTGKSSLLAAYVLPHLEGASPAVRALSVRSYDDPIEELREALLDAGWLGEGADRAKAKRWKPRTLLERAGDFLKGRGERPLVLFDQFEELVILHGQTPERVQPVAELLASLRQDPIAGLTVLLVLRDEYKGVLHRLGLPALVERANWREVPPFTEPDAVAFLRGGFEELGEERLRGLMGELRAIEDTRGLVRPIVLNLAGVILAREAGPLSRPRKPGALLSGYVRDCVERGEARDHAAAILRPMLTDDGTKHPRSVGELRQATGLGAEVVEGYLTNLLPRGLVRRITRPDAVEGRVWEVSHDFVARLLGPILDRPRWSLSRRLRTWLLPASLMLWLIVVCIMLPLERRQADQEIYRKAVRGINEAGFSFEEKGTGEGFLFVLRPNLSHEQSLDLARAGPHLKNLGRFGKIDLALSHQIESNLEPLAGLTSLQRLYLGFCPDVSDLGPLAGLKALEALDLSSTRVSDLRPLAGLKALKTLDLKLCLRVSDLGPLASLTSLQELDVSTTGVSDLEPLAGLKALETLKLSSTRVSDLGPLAGLKALQTLELERSYVSDLEPLASLTSLQTLDSEDCRGVSELKPLAGLKALNTLKLSNTRVSDLKPLAGLKALQKLDVNYTGVSDLGPLASLTSLQELWLKSSGVSDLKPLAGLTSLQTLQLYGSRVSSNQIDELKSINPKLIVDMPGP